MKDKGVLMKAQILFAVIFTAVSLLATGCANTTPIPNNQIPIGKIPKEEVNARITISSLNDDESFKNGDTISLVVEVKTKDQISFRSDYNVRVFKYENERWAEIQNRQTYPEPKAFNILSMLSPFVNKGIVDITPFIPSLEKRTAFRVVVFGRLVENGQVTDKQSAAYLDLVLKP